MKQTVQHYLKAYGHYITPVALFGGFIIDTFTLQRIDLLFANVVMIGYLALLSVGIITLHALRERRLFGTFGATYLTPALSIFIPFAFGGIFSGFTIFYSQSASAFVSLLFIGALVLVMVGTEYYKEHYLRISVQSILWYFALLSFLIFYVPMQLGSIGVGEFMLSGILSLIVAYGFMHLLARAAPMSFTEYRDVIMRGIGGIYLLVNLLYFANIIPPIPLSLKHGDVYYTVVRNGAEYTARAEHLPWYSPRAYTRTVIYSDALSPEKAVYAFSSIFAPTGLTATIYHNWQRYNKASATWEDVQRLNFTITGGRGNGYRGYTKKTGITSGKWRIRITTKSGQILGTIYFTVRAGAPHYEITEQKL